MQFPTTANEITGIEKSNLHKILPPLKSLHAARIDEVAHSKRTSNKFDHDYRIQMDPLAALPMFYRTKFIIVSPSIKKVHLR